MRRPDCRAHPRPSCGCRQPQRDGARHRPGPARHRRRAVLVAALCLAALGLAGCGSGSPETVAAIDELRGELELRDARIAELEEQMLTLDDEVALVRTEQLRDRTSTRLETLESAVGELEEQVQGTAEELTAEIAARETMAEELREELSEEIRGQLDAATTELRGELEEVEQGLAAVQAGLEQVRGGLGEVRGLIEDLEVRYETLRDRIDRISAR